MGDKKIYVVAKVFEQQGCICLLYKSLSGTAGIYVTEFITGRLLLKIGDGNASGKKGFLPLTDKE